MGALQLELRCPQTANGIVADPTPDWSFEALLLEINSLELKFNGSSSVPAPFAKTRPLEFSSTGKKINTANRNAFVMRVSDDEQEDVGSDDEGSYDQRMVSGKRFSFDELSISDSDDSENEPEMETQAYFMEKVEIVEGGLVELTREHQVGVRSEIRNQLSSLEMDLINESAKFNSSLGRVEKYTQSRREMDRRIDTQYQRKIAEGLDSHLTAVQRDHEHWSQIEERKIRDAAAVEEAKRKERAIQEEKIRQEKAKAEAEAQAKKKAEEARIATLEAERKAVKEAAENSAKVAAENIHATASEKARVHKKSEYGIGSVTVNPELNGSASKGPPSLQPTGNIIRSTESSLKLEEVRLQKYIEVDTNIQALRSGSNKDFQSYERKVARQIKQTSGTKEAVRAKATELINIFMDPSCSQNITIAMFAAKVISLCENPGSAPFALAHVIVLVTSKFPLAMDLILAEFHRACIYTVPKHISYSELAFETKEAYKKAIGFREEDGKVESLKKYLERLEAHMRLFGALVQTEIDGVQNMHGLKEGWAWLASLLNALPANVFSAVALEAFLRMAGFALFKRYKSQFRKILDVISRDFVSALKARKDSGVELVRRRIESYIETNQFMQEPEGWRLPSSALSSTCVPPSNDQNYSHSPNYSSYPSYSNSGSSRYSNTYRR